VSFPNNSPVFIRGIEMDSKLEKWKRWIDVIKKDVTFILIDQHVYIDLLKILKKNPQNDGFAFFYNFVTRGYIASTLMGIRRQIKTNFDSISLIMLLNDIQANINILNSEILIRRSNYKGCDSHEINDYLSPEFLEKHNKDEAQKIYKIITAKFIQSDINHLSTSVQRCEDYSDKRIAHLDKRPVKNIPTFDELNKCISLLEKLILKYERLITGSAYAQLYPEPQFPWKKIFEKPWIELKKKSVHSPTKRH
jgi:hypothetical protein